MSAWLPTSTLTCIGFRVGSTSPPKDHPEDLAEAINELLVAGA